MKKLPKVGQRVVVKSNFTYNEYSDMPIEGIIGQTGTVIIVDEREGQENFNVLVKFDTIFSKALHKGRYMGDKQSDKEDCWWLSHKVIKKLT